MRETCHRCHGQLPVFSSGEGERATYPSDGGLQPDALLFCPHCSAPQILLPEYMQTPATPKPGLATTGMVPPPHPREVDWPTALRCAAVVALVGAGLALAGVGLPFLDLLGVLWVIGCGLFALGMYAKRRPAAWMDRRIGLRVGFVTGLLMVVALGVSQASVGMVRRFGTHGMEKVDAQTEQSTRAVEAKVQSWLKDQGKSDDLQKQYADMMNSPEMNAPEMRAGSALLGFGIEGALLLLMSSAGGAFAGAVRQRRQRILRGA